MTVEYQGDLAVQRQPQRRRGRDGEAHGLQIAAHAAIWSIHVAPYQSAPPAGQLVQHAHPAHVAAMDDEFDVEGIEQPQGLGHDGVVPVTV